MAATATKPEVNRSQVIRDFVTKNPAMAISEVVTKLGEQGVKVSKNLVYMVKMKMKAKKVKEKKAKAAAKETQPAATPSSNGSAKAPNKSALVQAFLKGNRKMPAKEVVSAMAEKGITVTEGLVYFVKGKMKGKRSQKKKAEKAAVQVVTATASTPALANGDALKTILKVKNQVLRYRPHGARGQHSQNSQRRDQPPRPGCADGIGHERRAVAAWRRRRAKWACGEKGGSRGPRPARRDGPRPCSCPPAPENGLDLAGASCYRPQ